MEPIEFKVTIEDLRPSHEGKMYRRVFVATTRFDAIQNAIAQLLATDGLQEGSDFHIVDCR